MPDHIPTITMPEHIIVFIEHLFRAGLEERTMRAGGYLSAVDGLVVRNMVIQNAEDECVRLRCEYVTANIRGINILYP